MSLSNEIERLHELHVRGALSEEEFNLAKSKVLASSDETVADLRAELLRMHLQQDLDRLELQWTEEARDYAMLIRQGRVIPPSRRMALMFFATGTVTGLLIVCGVAPVFFLLGKLDWLFSIWVLGVASIAAGVFSGLFWFIRARQYESFSEDYQACRAKLLADYAAAFGADALQESNAPELSTAPSEPESPEEALQRCLQFIRGRRLRSTQLAAGPSSSPVSPR
jgi:hypothetical protein